MDWGETASRAPAAFGVDASRCQMLVLIRVGDESMRASIKRVSFVFCAMSCLVPRNHLYLSGGAEDLYIYPKNGQSPEQQSADRYECHSWAKSQVLQRFSQFPRASRVGPVSKVTSLVRHGGTNWCSLQWAGVSACEVFADLFWPGGAVFAPPSVGAAAFASSFVPA
jgi:hypothetical protein